MLLDEAQTILDSLAGTRSDYEFHNIYLESVSSYNRQIEMVLRDKESIESELSCLRLIYEKSIRDTENIPNIEEREFEIKLIEARSIPTLRRIKDLEADLHQLDEWLDNRSKEEIIDAAKNYESGESEHWTTILGKLSAIETLADDKVSFETMMQLSMLPLSDYKKSVQIMSRFANFIHKSTVRAEQQMLSNRPVHDSSQQLS